MKLNLLVAMVTMCAVLGGVNAEERLGVTIYPGAKYDGETSKAVKDMLKTEVACFTTSDAIAKVAAFYQQQGLKAIGDVTREGALFKKGDVDVTIQSPWMNMKSGAMMKDTLVSIVKTK